MIKLSLFKIVFYYLLFLSVFFSCSPKSSNFIVKKEAFNEILPDLNLQTENNIEIFEKKQIQTGADQFNEYSDFITDKKVALVVNQTSVIDDQHLVDYLLEQNVNIIKIFAPEHGFRGDIDRGEDFNDQIDEQTSLPIIALYGKNRKLKIDQIADVDVVIFDIQDIGVRFYTFISTLHYVMEACALSDKKLIILDRPNPLGDYVDGPVLNLKYQSFVGMHQIPVVHGLTIGELALMINGESWLQNGVKCDLEIVKILNYKHSDSWPLTIKPSPNLPNDISIRLYPSLCFFEATEISIGRGTKYPFQVIGYPDTLFGKFAFEPKDIPGMQMNPIHESKLCYGIDLRNTVGSEYFTLKYLIEFSEKFKKKSDLITNRNWFNLLAGNNELANQIISGMTESQIKETWKEEITDYKKMRKKYLLYLDFE